MTKVKADIADEYLDKVIALYKNHKETGSGIELTVSEFFRDIKSGERWKKVAEQCRALAPSKGEKKSEAYRAVKDGAECVTLSGPYRDKGNIRSMPAGKFTGLMAMDLDDLYESYEDIRKVLTEDPYVYAMFSSIGGNGLCVIFKVESEDKWLDAFEGISNYLINTYGIVDKKMIDASVKNVNRLRYISHDSRFFYHPQALVFKLYVKKADVKRYTPPDDIIDTDKDMQYVLSQFSERGIELHDKDGDWIRAGLAIAGKYGEAGLSYYQQASQFRHDYSEELTERRYLYYCRNARGVVGIATFYHIAKQLGCSIMCDQTRTIVSIAAMHKKQKASEKDTVKAISEQLQIPEPEVKNVVSQVYKIQGKIDTEEDLYDQLRVWLTREYPMYRNCVTRMIENADGLPYSEEMLNTVYFEAKKYVGKEITHPDFLRMVYSDFVPTYDPFAVFFNRYKDRKFTTGNIDKLARTLIAEGTQPEYVKLWLKKWLLGIVSSMKGLHCPIVFVLSGGVNKGKTEWFRQLLPVELNRDTPYTSYYGESTLDKGQDDQILMTKKLILFNDEFGGMARKDAKHFKNLTSKQTFSIREPYGRQHKDLRRLAMLCGSCNETDLLNDPTGNRRIVPVSISSIDFALYNSIDKIDLLLEIHALYMAGERHHVTQADIALLNQHTEEFEEICVEREMISMHFDIPERKGMPSASSYTATEVLLHLEPHTKKQLNVKRISQELKRLGFMEIKTAKRRYYEVIIKSLVFSQKGDNKV